MTDIRIAGVELLDASGTLAVFQAAGPITVRLRYQASRPVGTPISRPTSTALTAIRGPQYPSRLAQLRHAEGDGHVDLVIDSRGLRPGAYVLSVGILEARSCRTLDVHHRAYQFSIATQTNAHGPAVFGRDWHDRQRATDRLAIKKELSQ
jgi:hypothetical protein